jgi:hypothetical protein
MRRPIELIARWLLATCATALFALASGCATVQTDYPRRESQAWPRPQDTRLG